MNGTTVELPFFQLAELFHVLFSAPLYHLIIEGILLIWIIRLLLTKSYNPKDANGRFKLTVAEEEKLIAEWEPEPLVPSNRGGSHSNRGDSASDSHPAAHPVIASGKAGKFLNIDGVDCLNLGTFNFAGLVGHQVVEDDAVAAVYKYGVGSCGPRGFYGTIDVHLELERRLAEFTRTEEAILYSYGFATVASAIPAYAKRGDVVFVDDGVSFANQMGCLASRSNLRWFPHNDVAALRRLLEQQREEEKKNERKARVTRLFIVIEGLYADSGDMAPLAEIIELKYRYKTRIFLDESMSLCCLGATGRGVTEYLGVDMHDVDLVYASLETSLGSVGGFVCGDSFLVDHQRLSGLGYCFSASLPPLLAVAALSSLRLIDAQPEIFARLRQLSGRARARLGALRGLESVSHPDSPIQHVVLSRPSRDPARDSRFLESVCAAARRAGVALTTARYLAEREHKAKPASIRLVINSELTESEIDDAVDVMQRCYDLRVTSHVLSEPPSDQSDSN